MPTVPDLATETHLDAVHRAPSTALVGCAGWGITRDAAPLFPEQGSHLQRYAAVFGAVEINSSYYRPHRPSSYARWAASVPQAFRFSVKTPRTITHQLRLAGVREHVAQFAFEANALGEKLGCVLVQLPPSLAFHAAVAMPFFAQMRMAFACMLACEARHPSWFSSAATAWLQAHAITRVLADPPIVQNGVHQPTTAASYRRLHGAPHMYYSAYSDAHLTQLRQDLLHATPGYPAWVIFDNTAAGAAQPNALAVLGGQPPGALDAGDGSASA
ncbi:MAG: DUF72 domain-containing protein [Pseudomonadota bacterium]